jgi:UDP-N-acetylmuramate--alanine ligase
VAVVVAVAQGSRMQYHIVGIAGAGMSAIAQILLDQGHRVSGSDPQQNAFTEALIARGALIFQGHAAAYLGDADLLLMTSAVQADHVEVVEARRRGIPIIKRADLWAEWSQRRNVIGVAGTHGKTTTTAMIASILMHAGLNPGFLIGGESPDLGTNARWGDATAPLVIEADEYDHTFLALTPYFAVITNCEWDHVDIYADQAAYQAAFRQFVQQVEQPDHVIVCADDLGVMGVIEHPNSIQYGIDDTIARDPASCRLAPLDFSAANVRHDSSHTLFDVWRYDRKRLATRLLGTYTLQVPGVHNVRNALAAIAIGSALGVEQSVMQAALAAFQGALRRFEYKGEAAGVVVIDDYAHHPTEVRATIAAARARYLNRRIIAYVQPHTYSRTRMLFTDWPAAFVDADIVLVGAIYAAREYDTLGMSAQLLAEAIGSRAQAVGDVRDAADTIAALAQPGDVVVVMGAGTSQHVGPLALSVIQQRAV